MRTLKSNIHPKMCRKWLEIFIGGSGAPKILQVWFKEEKWPQAWKDTLSLLRLIQMLLSAPKEKSEPGV